MQAHYLKGVWVNGLAASPDILASMQPSAANYVLTSGQWHQGVMYQDAFFGTAQEFVHDFTTTMHVNAS